MNTSIGDNTSAGSITWPLMKVSKSREHSFSGISTVDLWNARRIYRCPIQIGEQGTTLDVIKQPIPETPQLDWALCFGDAVHTARVALDALAWGLAQESGAPAPGVRIAFPISNSNAHFNNHCSNVFPNLGPEVLERIRSVQPFQAADPDTSWLSLLSQFDNWDKHRGAVFTSAIQDKISFQFDELKLGQDDSENGGIVELDYPIDGIPDGEPLARLDFGTNILNLGPDSYADIRLNAVVKIGPVVEDAFRVSLDLANWVDDIVRFIALATLPSGGELVLGPSFNPPTNHVASPLD